MTIGIFHLLGNLAVNGSNERAFVYDAMKKSGESMLEIGEEYEKNEDENSFEGMVGGVFGSRVGNVF